MASLSSTSIVCHMPNQVAADVAGETVLMSLARSRCYGLGEIGSEIWSRLRPPVRVSDLVEELSERYEAPPGVDRARCGAIAFPIGGGRADQSQLIRGKLDKTMTRTQECPRSCFSENGMSSHNAVQGNGVYKLQALDRAFAVLDLLAASTRRWAWRK